MIEKPLNEITETDLSALVESKRAEGKRMDYKLALPGGNDKDSKEFLADVTSFANTDGGDLIIGIRDDDGIAAEIVGIASHGLDNTITAIENRVRDGVEPRLPSFHLHPIHLANGNVVLVLRIGASLVAPHRVSFRSESRFSARNSRGKYPMDTGEIRLAFAATDEMPRKLRDLHREAIAAADGTDFPVRMGGNPFIVLTVAPLGVLRSQHEIEVTREVAVLPPGNGMNPRFIVALEGMIVHAQDDAEAWAVTHRKGYIDFAWDIAAQAVEYPNLVPGVLFQRNFVNAANFAAARLIERGMEGPWIVMATIKQVRDYVVAWRRQDGFEARTQAAWRTDAYLGEITADALNRETLAPLLAAFWRVFGENEPPHIGE